MDTDKIKIFGTCVKVDSTKKLVELERAERVRSYLEFPPHTTQLTDSSQEKMKAKVDAIYQVATKDSRENRRLYD